MTGERLPVAASAGEGMRMAELIASLSFAIDLGVDMPMEWVLRTCLLSMRLGEASGLDLAARQKLYYLALLRHVGCTGTAHSAARDFGDDHGMGPAFEMDLGDPKEGMRFLFRFVGRGKPFLERARMIARLMAGGKAFLYDNAASHCELAERLATRLGFEPALCIHFREMYARWDGTGAPPELKGNAISLPVRVLQVAQDAATVHAAAGPEAACEAIRRRAGKGLDPDLVALFLRDAPALLAPLSVPSVWDAVLAAEPGPKRRIPPVELDVALEAVADFADFQTPYALGHARAVAALVSAGAPLAGLTLDESVSARRAAWLQDLGRVAVSEVIWSKPGPLAEGEWERVRLHPYYTERILARAPSLSPYADLASLHHERLDGSGYHRRATGGQVPMGARLLAAADAYQAMREDRPWREALAADKAAGELRREASAGKLDGIAVEAVLEAAGLGAGRISPATGDLSAREIEVLRLIAKGLSNKEMGTILFISPKTVGHHIQHIYGKIAVSSRAGATCWALERGLLAK